MGAEPSKLEQAVRDETLAIAEAVHLLKRFASKEVMDELTIIKPVQYSVIQMLMSIRKSIWSVNLFRFLWCSWMLMSKALQQEGRQHVDAAALCR